jgi:hemerythrin-like domain-containing protein
MADEDVSINIDRLLKEHKDIVNEAVFFIKTAIENYVNRVDYEAHIVTLLRLLEDLLKPHFEFEEKNIFPLLQNNPIIDELHVDHKNFIDLIEKAKKEKNLDLLSKILTLLDSHKKKEDSYLIPLLRDLLKK